jgi:hypothetical protein
MSSCFHQGRKGAFSAIVQDYWGEKLAFQKGGFSGTFSSMFKGSTSILDPYSNWRYMDTELELFKQFMWARNRVGIGVIVPALQAT